MRKRFGDRLPITYHCLYVVWLTFPTPEEVHVKVKDDLATSPLNIDEEFVSRICNAGIPGYVFGLHEHLLDNHMIIFCKIIDAPYVLSRDHEEMDRCCRVDILEYNKSFILINEISFPLALYNFTESA